MLKQFFLIGLHRNNNPDPWSFIKKQKLCCYSVAQTWPATNGNT